MILSILESMNETAAMLDEYLIDKYGHTETMLMMSGVGSITETDKFLFKFITPAYIEEAFDTSMIQGEKMKDGRYVYFIYATLKYTYSDENGTTKEVESWFCTGEGLEEFDMLRLYMEELLQRTSPINEPIKKAEFRNNYLVLTFDDKEGKSYRGIPTRTCPEGRQLQVNLGTQGKSRGKYKI